MHPHPDARPHAPTTVRDLDELLEREGGASLTLRFLVIHHGLRRDAARLAIAFSRAADDADVTLAVRAFWQVFAHVLRGHHEVEDKVVFPAAVAVEPALKDVVSALDEEHAALHPLLDALDAAVAALPATDAARKGSVAARELEALLVPHFATEEEHIVPVMRSFPPSPPGPQPDARVLAWAVLEAGPPLVEAFCAGLPEEDRAEVDRGRSELGAIAATCFGDVQMRGSERIDS